jgi:hypothetical protein
MKAPRQLPVSYMQNLHNLMRAPICPIHQMKKSRTPAGSGLLWSKKAQAMNTAMKANRKISTAPATGSTIGIMGTMDSTTSWGSSLWLGWGAWDMITPV